MFNYFYTYKVEKVYSHQTETEKSREPLKVMYPKFLVAIDNNLFR